MTDAIYDLGIPHPVPPYRKLIINAAITGVIPTKKDTPHVPITVDEIIADAIARYNAGASMIHVHARDAEGEPTYRREIFAAIIFGIRSNQPDLIICATTSGRTHDTFDTRSQALELEGDA